MWDYGINGVPYMKFFKYARESRKIKPYQLAKDLGHVNADGSVNVRPIRHLENNAQRASAKQIIEVSESLDLTPQEVYVFLKKSARNDK